MTIRDTDKGYARVLRSIGAAAKPGQKALLVGIQGTKAGESYENGGDATVGEIAAFHEFGLGVPERSWLRGWFDENRAEIQEDLRKVTRGTIEGRYTQEQGLEILGVKYQGQIQARIAAGIAPPNAPSTVARKESSTPLIDTGQLRSAVSFVLSLAQAVEAAP